MTSTNSVEHRGCRLSYTVRGDGPPVVFVQGVGVHGDGWLPQADGLKGRFRCLTFDHRGMGRSQPVGGPVTVEQLADDTRFLMDAVGWASAHVVGHSLGGLVALALALKEKKRVRSLALLCTFANGRRAAPLTARMMWLGLRSRVGTRRMKRRAFLRFLVPSDQLKLLDLDGYAAELEPLFGHDLGDLPPIVNPQLKAMRAFDAVPRLEELAGLPTLVVSAAHDPIAPPNCGRAIAAGIPGARYVELPDASHGFPIHQATKANTMLAEHFSAVEKMERG